MPRPERDPSEGRERQRRERKANEGLPAGLDDPGRAEELEHADDVHPSGARGDYRPSVPGTRIRSGE